MAQSILEITGITGVFTTRIDDVGGGISYIGKAEVGSLESNAVWQIFRIDESITGKVTILFADGENSFDKIWDDRLILSYA